ncbi:MAG TPA: hypothetical protein VFG51_02975 [Candidatus Saccharimonadia bacterium]|nr:hypothetical protein [Candidatus Saccharimonadia bacterium]
MEGKTGKYEVDEAIVVPTGGDAMKKASMRELGLTEQSITLILSDETNTEILTQLARNFGELEGDGDPLHPERTREYLADRIGQKITAIEVESNEALREIQQPLIKRAQEKLAAAKQSIIDKEKEARKASGRGLLGNLFPTQSPGYIKALADAEAAIKKFNGSFR